jgi:hypothetical protein
MECDGQEMLAAQLAQIRELRNTLGMAVTSLNRKMRECSGAMEQEGCMAELMKLSQMQMKLLPMEQELQRCHDESADNKSYRLSESDWKILERAIARKKRMAKPQRKRKAEKK